jgi:hypothetical protein
MINRKHISRLLAPALALSTLLLAPPAAWADLASTVSADLAASGVQGATVQVVTPAPATVNADDGTSDNLSFSQLPAYLSPNPAAPLPVINVTLAFAAASALSGVLTTPGLPGPIYTADIPRRMGVQLAVIEALKHAVAAGNGLAGFQLNISDAGASGTTQALWGAPDPAQLPAAQTFSSKMDLATLRSKVQASLPVWAKAAQVEVSEDAAAERVVNATLSLPPAIFAGTDVEQLTVALDDLQMRLASRGADIGRTLVTISDSQTGDPLYASADDAWWAYRSTWYSPLVLAHAMNPLSALADRTAAPLGPDAAQATSGLPTVPGG